MTTTVVSLAQARARKRRQSVSLRAREAQLEARVAREFRELARLIHAMEATLQYG